MYHTMIHCQVAGTDWASWGKGDAADSRQILAGTTTPDELGNSTVKALEEILHVWGVEGYKMKRE